MAKKEEVKIITVPARLSFPDLAKPKSFQGSAPKYGVQLVFPNGGTPFADRDGNKWKGVGIAELKKLAAAARDEKWGTDKSKHPKKLKMPFIDGNEKDLESHKDSTVINAKSKFKVPCIGPDKEDIEDMNDMYAGCWVRARVTCYAYEIRDEDNKKVIISAGVAFGLTSLQKVKNDKPFSGRGNAKDDFDAVELDDENFDESGSGEEENNDDDEF